MRSLPLVALSCIAVMPLLTCGRNTSPSGEDGARQNATNTSEESGLSESGSPSTDKLDVCSQLTSEEVEAALGKPVAAPVPGPALTSRRAGTIVSSCMFSSSEGFVSLDIKRQDPTSRTVWNAAKAYEELKGLIVNSDGAGSVGRSEEVSGVGISAFVENKEQTAGYKTTELRVLGKRSILTVRVVGSPATSTLEAAKTLALKAITRLESYEEAVVIPSPDTPSSAPGAVTNPSEDGHSRAPEESDANRKNMKDIKPSPARRVKNETSAAVAKSSRRRAVESNSKEHKKSNRESARRTPDRTKRVTTRSSNSRRRS